MREPGFHTVNTDKLVGRAGESSSAAAMEAVILCTAEKARCRPEKRETGRKREVDSLQEEREDGHAG